MLSRWLTRSRSRGGGDDADFVSIESSEEKTVEITDLTPETSYKLTAIAYNADQRPSNPATATFTTPEKPTTPDPDKATISIEEVKATYNSVTFTLKTANAARFGYKVDVPDGTAELTFVNGSEGGTYTTDNLEAATDYQITAVAYDENGQAADPVTHAFKTEALPTGPAVVSIEEVATTHSSIRFTLKLDNAVRIAYKVDVPDGTAEMTVVEKPQQSTFLVGSLQAETDYVLTVVAYNGKDEPSEPATHSFTTPAYTAFARIDAVATAHGIYLKADVDTGKFPLYFLKIFDPDLTESSADFEEHFKVDSREQFIHYLEVASLTAGLKTASFEEWNKTLLSTRSQQVLLYAAPVVRQGVDVVCEDYGEIIEIPLTIPARDELGAGQAAVTLGEPQVAGKELEIALKTASFTSATFSVKRNGFEKAYYNFITKADFDRKYGGNADTYVQRELIGKESGYPITLYSDNDINGSRLAYDTQYVLIALPEADNEDRYGVPTVVEFETLGYEATGSATATIAVNSITDNYGVSFYASVTVTPGADCAGYYYAMIEKTAYDAAANLGETICKQNGVKYRAATEDTTFSTDYYFAESYLVLIPVDNNGKMSAPVTSELLTTSAK
ncbi:fibronectin type III domain-containing protein [Alistipes putredinis]|uniref:fibronectin type III domain-containing protein n=1 Tax=Alistipes putredinis TaxID=28117 RepID=UPI003AEF5C97